MRRGFLGLSRFLRPAAAFFGEHGRCSGLKGGGRGGWGIGADRSLARSLTRSSPCWQIGELPHRRVVFRFDASSPPITLPPCAGRSGQRPPASD